MDNNLSLYITTWFPLLTICPYNKLPDFIYVTVEFKSFTELYQVRKQIRNNIKNKRCRFMENIASDMMSEFPNCQSVEVKLLFNKHVVKLTKN